MRDKETTKTVARRGALAGLAAAFAIAGVVIAFTSVPSLATPNKVDATHPCGSCHPPNKPPKKK